MDAYRNLAASYDRLTSDVDYEAVCEKAAAITPVPGGVGTVTTSVLLKHCLQACVAANPVVE